ncbi:uncharacterized protein LOC134705204 [Mytilus trossulus]|uniref:uncharacterized protein LOC134705204 n=1 Tax=Mytilus trossulus TaxID=6551 RepID=UPI003007816A
MFTSIWFLVTLLFLGTYGISPPITEEELREIFDDGRVELKPYVPPKSLFLHGSRAGFKHLYVDSSGRTHSSHISSPSITIAATQAVGSLAFHKAATIIGLMTRHMPSSVFTSVASKGHGVGVFTDPEKITVFPEFNYLKSPSGCSGSCSGSVCSKSCYSDGRKYEDMHGLTNSISGIVDDNILCNSHDPHHGLENILVHEFAHQVYNYMPSSDRHQVTYIYNKDKQHHTWHDNTYATSNAREFWAEASASFFRVVIRPRTTSATGGLNICDLTHVCRTEQENREWIKKHDPSLYNLLAKIYTNNRPSVLSGLKVCQ